MSYKLRFEHTGMGSDSLEYNYLQCYMCMNYY